MIDNNGGGLVSDPVIVQVSEADGVDRYVVEEILAEGRRRVAEWVPLVFEDATVTKPEVRDWVKELVATAVTGMQAGHPVVRQGRSLVLAGNTGTGKTWNVWGALRALSVSGVHCWWRCVSAPDMFALLRPRHGVDSEDVFEEFTSVERSAVLVIDDLGSVKDSLWTEEMLGRIVNRRYEWMLPTVITTNVPPAEFGARFGDRVASRLTQMATVVPMLGPDLRRQTRDGER